MNTDYRTQVVQEKTSTPFTLLDGEQSLLNGRFGMPASMILVSIFVTFVPPFIWGLLIVLFYRYSHKHDRIVVTNWRLVIIKRHLGAWHVDSMPLACIQSVHLAPLMRKIWFLYNLLDRLTGVYDLQVTFKDHKPYRLLEEVKHPQQIVNAIGPLLASH